MTDENRQRHLIMAERGPEAAATMLTCASTRYVQGLLNRPLRLPNVAELSEPESTEHAIALPFTTTALGAAAIVEGADLTGWAGGQ
jgi:hypothetical protein